MPVTEIRAEERLAPFRAVNDRQLAETPWWDERSRYDIRTSGTLVGRAAIVGYFVRLLAAIPNLQLTVERTMSSGSLFVAEWRATGTFCGGPLEGLRATGSAVELHGVDMMEWDGDVVRKNVVYGDGLDFARQVGLLPRRDSLGDRIARQAFNAATRLRNGGRQ